MRRTETDEEMREWGHTLFPEWDEMTPEIEIGEWIAEAGQYR